MHDTVRRANLLETVVSLATDVTRGSYVCREVDNFLASSLVFANSLPVCILFANIWLHIRRIRLSEALLQIFRARDKILFRYRKLASLSASSVHATIVVVTYYRFFSK